MVELERLRDMAQRDGRFPNQLLLPHQEPEMSILTRPSQVKIAFRYMTMDRKVRGALLCKDHRLTYSAV